VDNAFQWSASYSVKVEEMDDQHKKLFEIIRELYAAMRAGHGKDVMGEVLRRLIDYTVLHFKAEEKLMEKNGYPALAAHRAEHKALTDKVVTYKRNFDSGTAAMSLELMTFLQDWLQSHIKNVDQKYGDFMNAAGVH
jgi:hemerythrin